MNKIQIRSLLWGMGIALYLRFGLEPTGWFFYEASHTLSLDWLYWGYSIFRGGAHALSLWELQTLSCVLVGAVVGFLILWRAGKRVAL